MDSRRYVPRRALMYVPGSDERKLAKIPKLGADCVCLDCEDGVAFNAKEQARRQIRDLLETKSIENFFGKSECTVRVNSISSGLCHLDVDLIFDKPKSVENFIVPSAVHLPKCDSPEDIDEFAYIFNSATSDWLSASEDLKIGLIIFIESAKAMINLPEICERASKLKERSPLTPETLVFGR